VVAQFGGRLARWIFFLALVTAPWFFGGTTATSIVVINWLLSVAIGLWISELILSQRWPACAKSSVIFVALLLALGWWMTLNARSVYDPEFQTFALIENFAPRAPGSFDYALSRALMVRITLLLLSILFVVDLVRDEKALLQLWAVIAIAGGSIALLGLVQKAAGAEAIFWQTPTTGYNANFLATYYYHANAGAYLNLVLPFSAGLAARAFVKLSRPGVRALWFTVFILNVAAIGANTSRMAQLIGIMIVICLLIRFGPRLISGLTRSERNVTLAGAAAIVFVLFAIAQASHLEQPLHRWEKLGDQLPADARWAAAGVALHAFPEAGVLGFGPGTFRAVFPSFEKPADDSFKGGWRFLHEDYLQTVMEWGWLGSFVWALLFFGGIVVAIRRLRRMRESAWRQRVILLMSILALIGVALHALVDFPLQIESIQLYVATCLGVCWSSGVPNAEKLKS